VLRPFPILSITLMKRTEGQTLAKANKGFVIDDRE
ncbi:unnamed protein product, partial [marine sediment metagenome]